MIIVSSLLHIFQGFEVTQVNTPPDDFWHQPFLVLQQEHMLVLNQLSIALQTIANQSEELQILKDEIARLKGTSPRPKIPPGRLEGCGSGGAGGIRANLVEGSTLEGKRQA